MRKIVAAFDHEGFALHDIVVKTIKECGYEVIDIGTDSRSEVDYPDYAFAASQKIIDKEACRGIFVGGSGIGMCLAANKMKGIYAAVCHDWYSAHCAVENNDINVLCLGANVIGQELTHDLITAFLAAEFSPKQNLIRRRDKVVQIEEGSFELKNNCIRLLEAGQSIWLDNIRRGLIKNGKLAKDINRGLIRGITSNPSIIRKAITKSRDYDNALTAMALADVDPEDIFFQLMVEDIRNAADLFRELYIQSQGNDGFVSLEVSPLYAHDPEKTAGQAKYLWKAVNRPNLMIKIPVTDESIPVITELTASGINLNLTLIFSSERYEQAALAYISGLQQRIDKGETIDKIRSVASVFMSRIDTKIDPLLAERGVSSRNLQGKAAIRNAQKIFNRSIEIFESEQFNLIREHGGNAQRILWASTSTKNPLYKPTLYVDELVGKNTINAVTPITLDSLLKSCNTKPTLPVSNDEINDYFTSLRNEGVDIYEIYSQLESEGIETFSNDYQETISSIKSRCETIRSGTGNLQNSIEEAFRTIESDSVMRRIFSKDPTVWTFETQVFPKIRNRLGWLDTYKNTETSIPDYIALRNELKKEGINKILLIGCGTLSLPTETIKNVFSKESDMELEVINSIDPIQIIETQKNIDPKTTLFIVSSKSGADEETCALCSFFYTEAQKDLAEKTGHNFIAVTDAGSNLEKTAKELQFRKVFFSDPAVGESYSALTPFGILPATLAGLDGPRINSKIHEIMQCCSPSVPVYRNEGVSLGTFIAAGAALGKNKLTIISDRLFVSLESWIKKLITGSSVNNQEIIPVISEPELEDKSYSSDRIFVYLNVNNSQNERMAMIRSQGHPVFEISIDNGYDLFAEFYRWELAISVAFSIMKVNPFALSDQHDNKTRIKTKIDEFQDTGSFSEMPVIWSDEHTEIWAKDELNVSECTNYNEIITRFIETFAENNYFISINAYLPENAETKNWMQQLRNSILHSTNCATTLDFGTCLLPSGSPDQTACKGEGLFIQIIADHKKVLNIPGKNISFNLLERAQSLADFERLVENGQKVIRIRFKNGLPYQN